MITRRVFNPIAIATPVTGALAAMSSAAASSGDTDQSSLGSYDIQTVSFDSSGETLVGKLLIPASEGPHPAVVIIGPVAFVKEQSPVQYATRLASRGLAVLIFDPRFHGESSGTPRRYESGEAKVEDCQAALGFLVNQEGIDANRLHLLGICQGVNWAIETAVTDDRVASLGVVAGHYLTAETARMYLGSDAVVQARMKRDPSRRRFRKNRGSELHSNRRF